MIQPPHPLDRFALSFFGKDAIIQGRRTAVPAKARLRRFGRFQTGGVPNMSNYVISISREFGSGGRLIGKRLAARLGIPCYDRTLIQKTAEKSGLSPEFIAGRRSGPEAASTCPSPPSGSASPPIPSRASPSAFRPSLPGGGYPGAGGPGPLCHRRPVQRLRSWGAA